MSMNFFQSPLKMIVVHVFLLMGFPTEPGEGFAGRVAPNRFYMQTGPRHILAIDPDSLGAKTIYRGSQNVLIDQLKPSPGANNFVGFIEINSEHMRPGDLGYALRTLVVINSLGKVIAKAESVICFAWSPSGDSIVFTKGLDYGGHETKLEGIWVFRLSDPAHPRRISLLGASDINWTDFNGRIYIAAREVYEIDPKDNHARLTNFRGIYFSPDGRFYFRPNYEGTGFELHETSSGRTISLKSIQQNVVNYYKWVSPDQIVIGDITFEKKMIDPTSGSVRKSFSGKVIGIDNVRKTLLLMRDKSLDKSLSNPRFERLQLTK